MAASAFFRIGRTPRRGNLPLALFATGLLLAATAGPAAATGAGSTSILPLVPEDVVLLYPEDFELTTGFELGAEKPLTNMDVALWYRYPQAQLTLLEQIGRKDGHYASLRRDTAGPDGVQAVSMSVSRYTSPGGAADGFGLDASLVSGILSHFQPVQLAPVGDETRAWRFELGDGTALQQVLFRRANYVIEVTVFGDAGKLTPNTARQYAELLDYNLAPNG